MTRFILLLVLLFSPSLLAAEATNVSHSVSQARFFIRKGWYEDARMELETAAATSEGQHDQQVFWLLAQVCYELLDVEAALDNARRSAALVGISGDPDIARQARDLVAFLSSGFGYIDVNAPQTGMESRLQLELTSPLFDPDLKKFSNQQALRLREKTPLPVRIAVPVGEYRVNGHPVTVAAGEISELALPMAALGARGLAALQVTRLEICTGFDVFLGQRVDNLYPGLVVQIALTQPIARALLGVTAEHTFRNYSVDSYGSRSDPAGGSVGVRLAMEIFLSGPFVLRPGIGYRYGLLPGVRYDCLTDGSQLSCSSPDLNDSDTQLYGVARVHIPYAELAIDYREGGRTNALGMGLRFAIDQNFGSLPDGSDAHYAEGSTTDEQGTLTVDAADTSFSVTGIRLMSNLSIAF